MSERRSDTLDNLCSKAHQIRVHVIRIAGMSDCHTGGSLSVADILAALYFHTMNVDPKNPSWDGRDYLIFSKGHCVPALGAALAMRGFFSENALTTHLQIDSIFPGHACAILTPGIDASTGSLGHGLSIGVGCALGIKMDHASNRAFVVLGDGELDEGSNWEAAMAASHHKLDNLTAIIDRNKCQTAPTETLMALEPLEEKWKSFGWATRPIDGHNMAEIVSAFDALPFKAGKPSLIIANTIKGYGCPSQRDRHYARLNAEQYAKAMAELESGVEA